MVMTLSALTDCYCKLRDAVEGLRVTATTQDVCLPVGWVNVNADGTIADSCGSAQVARTAVGTYALVAPAGAVTVQLHVVENLTDRDSIEIHGVDFVGSTVHISEGDNSASANTLRDRPFSAVWYGPATAVVTGVDL